jgi:hypothetical protein
MLSHCCLLPRRPPTAEWLKIRWIGEVCFGIVAIVLAGLQQCEAADNLTVNQFLFVFGSGILHKPRWEDDSSSQRLCIMTFCLASITTP